MTINEPTRPDTDKGSGPVIMPSPVTFAPYGDGNTRQSPVTLHSAGMTRDTPVSLSEAAAAVAQSEMRGSSGTTDRPVIGVEESFFTSAVEFVLKMGHRDVPKGEAEFCADEDVSVRLSSVLNVVNTWQLVARDITDEQAAALGHENAEKLADDMGWHDEDWGITPVTVIQVERT